MHLSFDTESLTATDRQILAILAGAAAAKLVPTEELVSVEKLKPAPAPVEKPAKPAPAEKPKPAKTEPPAPKETPAEDVAPATAVPPAEEAGVADLQAAIKLASKLISQGKTADVKTALASAGVSRVSELDGDKIESFMSELNDA